MPLPRFPDQHDLVSGFAPADRSSDSTGVRDLAFLAFLAFATSAVEAAEGYNAE